MSLFGSVELEEGKLRNNQCRATVCPRSSDPFYIVTYYINGVTTSGAYRIYIIYDIIICRDKGMNGYIERRI